LNIHKTFLVTGGAGFIGSHLVRALVSSGYRVRVLDNLSTGKMENIADLLDGIEFVRGDVCDSDLLEKLSEDVSGIFHLAALVSVPLSVQNPRQSFEQNVLGVFNVFEAVRHHLIPVVYASSAAVYGDNAHLPLDESESKRPLTPYANDKCYAETLASMYSACYRVPSVGLRFFNVYGERQDPASPYSGVISKFISNLEKGERITVFGDGSQSRDFVYAGDVAEALVLSMLSHQDRGSVFNVGSGQRVTINQLIGQLGEIHKITPEVLYLSPRHGDILHSQANISAIENSLGWRPKTGLEEGLRRLVGVTSTNLIRTK